MNGLLKMVNNITGSIRKAIEEKNKLEQEELLRTMTEQLNFLKCQKLDEIDLTELKEAADIISLLYDELKLTQ